MTTTTNTHEYAAYNRTASLSDIRQARYAYEAARLRKREKISRAFRDLLLGLAIAVGVIGVLGAVAALAIANNAEHRARTAMEHAHYERVVATSGGIR